MGEILTNIWILIGIIIGSLLLLALCIGILIVILDMLEELANVIGDYFRR